MLRRVIIGGVLVMCAQAFNLNSAGLTRTLPRSQRARASLCAQGHTHVDNRNDMATGVRMTWLTSTDPATGAQYWYNKETGESTWDTPAVMTEAQAQYAQATPSAQPMAKGTRSDSLWEQGGAGSKEQQLAKLLINGEKRLQARREKNALEAELRAEAEERDRRAREEQAAMLAEQRRAALAATKAVTKKGGVLPNSMNSVGVAPQAKNAILAISAAKAAKASGAGDAAETNGLMAALNPIKSGVVWWKEPSLLLFFGAKVGLILYILFFGIHGKFISDFGPYVAIHDGQVDLGAAATAWYKQTHT